MLVIAYNQALIERSKEEGKIEDTPGIPGNEPASQHDNWKDIYSQPTLIEDDERMDIIGQNGNDGLHYDSEDDEDKQNKNIGKGAIPPTSF